jgi:uncharacterized protein (DUF1800 family)
MMKPARRVLFSGLVLLGAALAAGAARDLFHQPLSGDTKIQHALDRLTFGARPGDVDRVRALGLKKWLDLQLHPERIPENPALAAKLAPLDSLTLPQAQLMERYPPPQALKAMAEGKMPLPQDPAVRRNVEQMIQRYEQRRKEDEGGKKGEDTRRDPRVVLSEVLSRDELRTLRSGSVDERKTLLASFPMERFEQVAAALPQNLRRQLVPLATPEQRRKLVQANAPQAVIANDLAEGKLYRAIESERQLQELLTDFWFNHFNVFLDKGADRFLVPAYEREAIRPHVLGKFEELVRATAEHPAMLFYLDNWQSVSPEAVAEMQRRMPRRPGAVNASGKIKKMPERGLNENYARELMELHTLGVDGGYTQKDVTEVARAFTGWTIRDPRRDGTFFFNARVHDRGEKTVLGVTVPAGGGQEDGTRVIALLARHPSTAKFVSTKLARYFVADEPPASLIEKMTRTWASTGGDIRAVLHTMIDAHEFFSQGAYRAKVKTPLQMIVSAVRATGASVDFAMPLAQQIAQLGQPLYRKQEPTGYSSLAADWVNSSALLARMNFSLALAQNKIPGVRVAADRFGADADPEAVSRALLGRSLSAETRAALGAKLKEQTEVTPALVAGLVIGSPEFQRR